MDYNSFVASEKKGSFMAKQNQTMLEGALLPNIISYTIPIILTSILQLLFNKSWAHPTTALGCSMPCAS